MILLYCSDIMKENPGEKYTIMLEFYIAKKKGNNQIN